MIPTNLTLPIKKFNFRTQKWKMAESQRDQSPVPNQRIYLSQKLIDLETERKFFLENGQNPAADRRDHLKCDESIIQKILGAFCELVSEKSVHFELMLWMIAKIKQFIYYNPKVFKKTTHIISILKSESLKTKLLCWNSECYFYPDLVKELLLEFEKQTSTHNAETSR